MSCLALAPLLLALVTALAATLYVLQRKSLAQAICVQESSRLGAALARDLTALTRLNPTARRLEVRIRLARAAVRLARLSMNPALIVAAEARLRALELERLALDLRQRAILARAEVTRFAARRELGARLRALGGVLAPGRAGPALAVVAQPPGRLAPEYEPAPDFDRRQRQDFRARVPLTPAFARNVTGDVVQSSGCAITLRRKERRWENQIVEASAPLSSPWSR